MQSSKAVAHLPEIHMQAKSRAFARGLIAASRLAGSHRLLLAAVAA
jgi:hypothetical protein